MMACPNTPKSQRNYIWLCALIFFVIISRLPAISHGFGLDDDCWSVAYAAKEISSKLGNYIPSRLPGYPVAEHIFAFVFALFGVGFV